MRRVVSLVLIVMMVLAGCGTPSKQIDSGEPSLPDPISDEQEVFTMLGPKDDAEVKVEVKTSGQNNEDPRLPYTKAVIALIDQIAEDPDQVSCSASVKEQLKANPTVIPEMYKERGYYVYSIGSMANSTEVNCSVGYYDNGNMVVELITFVNNEGLITIENVKELDKLLAFLSGGVYVV